MAHLPEVYQNLHDWIERRKHMKRQGLSIGFVPTMGALHAGHLSLLERSREENDVSVLSIYVNPTQFDNPDDLARYPITLEHDKSVAQKAGVDCIVLPTYTQIYPDSYRYKISEKGLSEQLCGAHRPGHFDGVLTVVMKLLNLVQPNRAYFGEKDFQQLELIRGMTEAFFLDCEIVPCPTLRETDGLAMSSRNVNLSPQARALAPRFRQELVNASSPKEARLRLIENGFKVDYVEDIAGRRYGAVHLDHVRLIDNVQI